MKIKIFQYKKLLYLLLLISLSLSSCGEKTNNVEKSDLDLSEFKDSFFESSVCDFSEDDRNVKLPEDSSSDEFFEDDLSLDLPEDDSSAELSKDDSSAESSEDDFGNDDSSYITIESAGERFAEKFTDEEVIFTDNLYQSPNVCVSFSEIEYGGKIYFVQDIYIKQIESLSAGFPELKFINSKYNDYVYEIVTDYRDSGRNVISAISGDYCRLNKYGAKIRNGVLYDSGVAEYDVCIIYEDGRMVTMKPDKFNAEAELKKGAWQVWDFGPSLLDKNGDAIADFSERDDINGSHPRTMIGYYEPGHYCFVVAGGRNPDVGYGIKLNAASSFMNYLGCKTAYNLDGGQSAVMVFGENISNEKYQGSGRPITDIVFIEDFLSE